MKLALGAGHRCDAHGAASWSRRSDGVGFSQAIAESIGWDGIGQPLAHLFDELATLF